jgi:hypothetical protein
MSDEWLVKRHVNLLADLARPPAPPTASRPKQERRRIGHLKTSRGVFFIGDEHTLS